MIRKWQISVPTFEEILFGLFLIFVLFLPFTKISVPVIGLYEFTLADLILVFLFFVNITLIKRIKPYYKSYLFTFFLFVGSVLVSVVMIKSFRLYFLGVLPYAFATLVVLSTLIFFSGGDHLKQMKWVLRVIFLSLFLCAIPVYYQLLTGDKPTFFYDRHGWRYTFLAQNPNQFGVYMILFFFLLTLISLNFFKDWLARIFYLMIFFFPVALFSGSKTAALVFTTNFLVVAFILYIKSSTLKKIIIGPSVLLIILFSIPIFLNFIKHQGGQINRALTVFEIISSGGEVIDSKSPTGKSQGEGISLFLKYPVLGVGMANKPMHSSVTTEIHNTYIKFLAETGIVGFLCFLLIFTLPVVSMWFSKSSMTVKVSMLIFYMMFAAMNWPHMLIRQRWVWFFMVLCFVISKIDKNGNVNKSKLEFLN